MRPIALFLSLVALIRAEVPIRQATEARLWLRSPSGEAPHADFKISFGTAGEAKWQQQESPASRTIDVQFPIRWWSWTETTISFTATADQAMEIVLSGPWTAGTDGKPLHQEIMWDQLTATGTELTNGGFEQQSPLGPVAWIPLFSPYLAAGDWPLDGAAAAEGKFLAATWHDRPLAQKIQLKAGQPVSLTFRAKSATPPGFTPPARLGSDTPAHRAAAKLKRGVNLGNCWEAPPPYSWGIRYTVEDIDRIAAEGFDHIRVPVGWHFFLTDSNTAIQSSLLIDLEPVLRRALEKKLHVLLDWHHFHELTDDPSAHRARFVKGWETIARHFQSWPPELYLELLNEPRDALTTAVANGLHAEAIAAIRKIDPTRIILLSPSNWGDIRELDKLHLPDDDDRLIVTVHCYEPFHFTHQRAGWVQLDDLRDIVYPGPPATPLEIPPSLKDNAGITGFITRYNTLADDLNPSSMRQTRELLDFARDWSAHFGRPVHLGEFGSINRADPASRARHAKDVRTLAEARGIPWTLWDWKATFGYWDPSTNSTDLKQALFD